MKNVLAICATRSSLSTPLSLIQGRANVVIMTRPEEIRNIKQIDDPNVYDLIVMGAIDWRIPATSSGLVALFRPRFNGVIIAVGRVMEWRSNMENAGCDHVFEREDQAAAFIRDTLFPDERPED